MRRTDELIITEINHITIVLDTPEECKRWNEYKHDIIEALAYIEELTEINCSPNQNTLFEIAPGSYSIIPDATGKNFMLTVLLENYDLSKNW